MSWLCEYGFTHEQRCFNRIVKSYLFLFIKSKVSFICWCERSVRKKELKIPMNRS